MNILELIHEHYIHGRRVSALCANIAPLLLQNWQVLDVGTGDGLLASKVMQMRPDIDIKGIDISIRTRAHIPVKAFDGREIPYKDSSFNVVTFIDVLHHIDDPVPLLHEAMRVATEAIIIKDHLLSGFLAKATLHFMDDLSNTRYKVPLVYNYWPWQKWHEVIETMGLTIDEWNENLGLYPWPFNFIFDRSLHFITRILINKRT
jgi:ubiquinone/menaquinone biosynthesis C-methylase UbiE